MGRSSRKPALTSLSPACKKYKFRSRERMIEQRREKEFEISGSIVNRQIGFRVEKSRGGWGLQCP